MRIGRVLKVLLPIVLAATATAQSKPTIVLVHGAFADAAGWSEVIGRLQRRGYNVVAVENPLSSLPADVATTKRLVDAQPGDVVLVAHSYGGAVISGASAGDPKVKALVFVAAFAPDANEPLKAVGAKFPAPPLNSALKPDAAGFLYVDTSKFHDAFAADLPREQTRIAAASQKPLAAAVFDQSNPGAGWKTIPTWFIVAKNDHAINPDAERFYAKRAKAKTIEVESSHAVFLSHPDTVVSVIVNAATAVAAKR
ncbi:MAG TPA: alpha/beta hydrolase [Gemmatimonadaceae bacterium]|jgi:pimeloyl-ACP methyl ester carboxylesterase